MEIVSQASAVVCGWGKHGNLGKRGDQVLEILDRLGIDGLCLGQNGDATPKHPLYIGYKESFRRIRYSARGSGEKTTGSRRNDAGS